MSMYSWSFLDPYTVIKHGLAVFCLQIPHKPLERYAGAMHSIYHIRAMKACLLLLAMQGNVDWVGHGRKPLLTSGCHINNQLRSLAC